MFRTESGTRRALSGLLVMAALAGLAGCRQQMAEQPSYSPLEASEFFEDGRSSRLPVEGTVARGQLRADAHFYTGKIGDEAAALYPFEITREVLLRGRERYDIYCAPCHATSGRGNGIIVRRGFRPTPSFLDPALVARPAGHYVDVMTNGFGAMPSYAAQVPPSDRWAIAAYIQALQLSQNVNIDDLPQERQTELRSMIP
jgi:mono/diheme cytochrome c family protein